jgi:hypothetical protein
VSIAPDYRPVGTTDSVLVTLVLASDGSTDVVARVIAALGLGVAIVGIVVNWLLWYRSRPRLKVRLHAETDPDPMRGALAIEVVSVGRLAVVVKELGLRDHIVAGNQKMSLLSMPVEPTSAKLPLTLEPTEFLEAEVGMDAIVNRWDVDKKLALVAWAEAGDGRKFESRPLKIQTPRHRRV